MSKKWLTLCFLLWGNWVYTQQVFISGITRDISTGQNIPYVSVNIAGTGYGTLTDQNGDFKLYLPEFSATDTLSISAIGYETADIPGSKILLNQNNVFYLQSTVYDLAEVQVKPQKLRYKYLGINKYENICTSFIGNDGNWLGKQAAIRADHQPGTTVFIESFGFYIIKNDYTDSLTFRIMLYEVNEKGFPGQTFLKKPIVFSTNVKKGEVRIDLKEQNISVSNGFFISLECLEDEMDATKFCFAGDIKTPSFFKTSVAGKWGKVKGGGGAFNVKVSYKK